MVGQAFLPRQLPGALLVLEAGLGADLTGDPGTWPWTDMSADYQQNPGIQITIGRQQETQVAPPAQLTATLNNPDGRYSQFNPLGPNWPHVREGTPIRQRLVIGGISYTRFQGRAIGWKPTPNTSGSVQLVQLTAAGITRVMGQRSTPVKSPVYRLATAGASSTFYPLDDAAGATQAYSATGGPPLATTVGSPTFGVDGPAGAAGAVNMSGACLSGTFPADRHFTTSWRVDLGLKYASPLSASNNSIMDIQVASGGSFATWRLLANNVPAAGQGLQVGYITSDGSAAGYASGVAVDDGTWHLISLTVTQAGANVTFTATLDGTVVLTQTITAMTLSVITGYTLNPTADAAYAPYLSSLVGWVPSSGPSLLDAFAAFTGETPEHRLSRLCAEQGVPFTVLGWYDTQARMGPQERASWLDLVRSCERAEAGWVYDGLSDGISLMAPSQRYDQVAQFSIDGNAGEIIPPFQPLPDDFGRLNKTKVDRLGGSSAVYEDTDGPLGTNAVGVYEGGGPAGPINYASDTALNDRARWEIHKGTLAGFRWPTVTVDIRKIPDRAAAIAAMKPGLMFTATPPAAYQPAIPADELGLIAEGWTETTSRHTWRITFNCSSQDTYRVWKIGDPILGRLGTTGHTLAAGASAGASSLSLTTPAGSQVWTTQAGDFPLYLTIDGIKVKVTNITGSASPQTATVDPTTITKALAANTPISMWKNGVIKL